MYLFTFNKTYGGFIMGVQGKKTTIYKLKGLRAENNFTQSEVADKLDISKATYARKEN
jgi:DNA-binding XRE family transcriptional regulator